jgi:uncharacterized membrane protein YkoI
MIHVSIPVRALVLGSLVLATVLARAQESALPWVAQAAVETSAQLPDIGMDEAATIARNASGGRVLGVRRVELLGRPVYEVRVLLSGGVVRTMQIDAPSGAIW